MGAHARLAAIMAVLALSLAACGRGGTSGSDQAADPEETVTVTAPAETVTVTETSTPTAEPEPAGDPCADLEGGDELSFIFVGAPTPGQAVSSGFEVSGCSNTFEATYVWELVDREGTVLAEDFGTASCGSGCVGDFSFTVDYEVDERQVATLRVFEESAEDGSEVNVNSIPLVLEP